METLESLLEARTHKAWLKIIARLDKLSGDSLTQALVKVSKAVKLWPITVHRPGLDTWNILDPRNAVCRIVHETSLYNDYIEALTFLCTCKDKAGLPCAYRPMPPVCIRCKGRNLKGLPDFRLVYCLRGCAPVSGPVCGCGQLLGYPAIKLERQYTGGAVVAGLPTQIGVPGSADLKGGLVIQFIRNNKVKKLQIRLELEIKMETGKKRENQITRCTDFAEYGALYIFANTFQSAISQIQSARAEILKMLDT